MPLRTALCDQKQRQKCPFDEGEILLKLKICMKLWQDRASEVDICTCLPIKAGFITI